MSPTALRPAQGNQSPPRGAARRPRRLSTAVAKTDDPAGIDLRDPALYFDRELSWLSFNERVLDQARSGHPLLERVKFLAIAANNLDEFFMVRLDQRATLARGRATAMLDEISEYWAEGLRPALAAEQIVVVDPPEYTEDDKAFIEQYFNVHVCPVLTPLAFDPGHPFPHISNRSRNLAVVVDHRGRTKFARVKVPDLLSRFVALPAEPGAFRFALLEDVIRENLTQLFPGVRIRTAHFFRVVRDMDMEVAHTHDAAETLLEVVDRSLKEQRHGPLSLLEVEHGMPSRVLEILIENFEVGREVVVRSRGRMGLADWIQLLTIPRPDLKDRPLSPSKLWRKGSPDIFDEIRYRDQFVHHPFDSFQSVEAFVDAAIDDPRVFAIKMTLYRIGANSPVVDRLIKAAERGKQVAVLVELKARLDERSNIDWATRLEEAGVHVVYGVEKLKPTARSASWSVRKTRRSGAISTSRPATTTGRPRRCIPTWASSRPARRSWPTPQSCSTISRGIRTRPITARCSLHRARCGADSASWWRAKSGTRGEAGRRASFLSATRSPIRG